MAAIKFIKRTVALDGSNITEQLPASFFNSESSAHTFIIAGVRDGVAVAFTGSVRAIFHNPNDADVSLTGSIVDGAAVLTLSDACYALSGPFTLTIDVNGATIYECQSRIKRRSSATAYDPTGEISVAALSAEIEEMRTATAAASAAASAARQAAASANASDNYGHLLPGTYETKLAARQAAVNTYQIPVSKGTTLYYYLTDGTEVIEKNITGVAGGAESNWEGVNTTTVNLAGNMLLSGAYESKAAARSAVFRAYGVNVIKGVILHYFLTDGTEVIEQAKRNGTSSADGAWIDLKAQYHNDFHLLPGTYATRAAARAASYQTYEINITKGGVLHYFLDDGTEVLESSNRDGTASADSAWKDISRLAMEGLKSTFQASTEPFMNSINRRSKYLTRFCFVGDSLTANPIGGDIPQDVDEGNTRRPMRLLSNGIPRRFYDFVSWNKPIWRRLDHSDWTKSGFAAFGASAFFQGTQEVYHRASASGSYIEISVPRGYEHFALMYRRATGCGNLTVTLNGGAVGSYANPYYTSAVAGNSVVDASVVPASIPRGPSTINAGAATVSANGNVYAIAEFNNLPDQNNVIRFTTSGSGGVDVWGGFYWHGNTIIVVNCAHGGFTTSDLLGTLQDEVANANFDAIIFEVTEMNDLRLSIDQTLANLETITNMFKEKDILYTSCNPLGLSIAHDVNFYTEYTNPTQLELNNAVARYMQVKGLMFVDIFDYYHKNIVSRGGSLESGEGGLWYTLDGQHGNEAGVSLWFSFLKSILKNKPIMAADE